MNDQGKTFDIAEFKGKMVVVHYWATASTTYTQDFAVLKQILTQVNGKNDVALVCICLDEDAAKAKAAVAQAQVPGVHLFQSSNNASGLNSPLATQYGIHILPTLFLVNREGVVTNNSLQMSDIVTSLK
ncbi:MAG: redoxin family protein [Planctomycetes bacterium]|nr:redoxin family protein [Planctomycetota bacterium]